MTHLIIYTDFVKLKFMEVRLPYYASGSRHSSLELEV